MQLKGVSNANCTRRPSRSATPTMGVTRSTLVKGAHWLCMYLVVIDAHSKWMDVHIMRSTTSAATLVKLRAIFATHGLLETIVSDNGPNFRSAEFENFLSAEWAVRAFKEGIEKMEEGNVQDKKSRFLLKYRTTPNTTTGVAPAA